ncbi:MAG: lysyl oxidase family protein [Candidatus Limnocylindrales bacterium]
MRIPVVIRVVGVALAATLIAPAALADASVDRSVSADPSGTAFDLLPDLRMAPLYGMYVATTPNDHVRLHFGTIGWNVGMGPLEADGKKVAGNDQYMTVRQRIYDSEGGSRTRRTPATMIYDVGDHHVHWHLIQFMFVQLYKVSNPDDVYGLRKIGYCLLDARQMNNPPEGSPPEQGYDFESCGLQDSTSVKTGLSIGWGDDYPPTYAHQWIDITDLAKGRYRLCASVDPLKVFVELDETNNQRWTDVRIDPATLLVTVLATGAGECGPGIP